jgi:hypothetical protein
MLLGNRLANETLSCFRLDQLQQELEARSRPIRMPLEIPSANENLFCFRADELQQELEVKMAEIRKCGANYTALTTKLGTVRNKKNRCNDARDKSGPISEPKCLHLKNVLLDFFSLIRIFSRICGSC